MKELDDIIKRKLLKYLESMAYVEFSNKYWVWEL